VPASVAPFAGSYSIAQWSLPGGTRRLTWVVRHASCRLPCWYPRTADPGPTLSASANSTTIRRLAGFFGREGPAMCVPRYAVSPMERLVSLRDTTGHGKPAPWQETARTPPTETETSIAPAVGMYRVQNGEIGCDGVGRRRAGGSETCELCNPRGNILVC